MLIELKTVLLDIANKAFETGDIHSLFNRLEKSIINQNFPSSGQYLIIHTMKTEWNTGVTL